jgi:hypothetical protein
LAFVGFILPCYFFVSFLISNGLDLPLLLRQLLANNIPTSFALDLIITAVAFWVLLREARRSQIGYGWASSWPL